MIRHSPIVDPGGSEALEFHTPVAAVIARRYLNILVPLIPTFRWLGATTGPMRLL